jgi:hypothetical protein
MTNEMGRAYSELWREDECIQEFGGEARKKETIRMT